MDLVAFEDINLILGVSSVWIRWLGIHAGELLYTCRFVCACSGSVYSEEVQGSGFALPIGRLSTVTFELSCFLVLLFNLYSHERFVC